MLDSMGKNPKFEQNSLPCHSVSDDFGLDWKLSDSSSTRYDRCSTSPKLGNPPTYIQMLVCFTV
jgi:hypothetical protein